MLSDGMTSSSLYFYTRIMYPSTASWARRRRVRWTRSQQEYHIFCNCLVANTFQRFQQDMTSAKSIWPSPSLTLLAATAYHHHLLPPSPTSTQHWMTSRKNLRLCSVRRCLMVHQRSLIWARDLGRWRISDERQRWCTCTFTPYFSTQSGRYLTVR